MDFLCYLYVAAHIEFRYHGIYLFYISPHVAAIIDDVVESGVDVERRRQMVRVRSEVLHRFRMILPKDGGKRMDMNGFLSSYFPRTMDNW